MLWQQRWLRVRSGSSTGLSWRAVRLAGFQLKQLALNLAYFAQAAMVGRWMRRNGLTHLHTHYSSTVALLVHKNLWGGDF